MEFECVGNVLQCGAVCCSVLQCVAVCCSVVQCVAALHTVKITIALTFERFEKGSTPSSCVKWGLGFRI